MNILRDILKIFLGLLLAAAVFFLLLFFKGMDKTDSRKVMIKNESNDTIYCVNTNYDSFTDWYKMYGNIDSKIDEESMINPNSTIFLFDYRGFWNSKIHFFIIDKDSVNKYGWDVVVQKRIYTKKYKYNVHDLDSINWTIIYK
jgi:hypothetical protein